MGRPFHPSPAPPFLERPEWNAGASRDVGPLLNGLEGLPLIHVGERKKKKEAKECLNVLCWSICQQRGKAGATAGVEHGPGKRTQGVVRYSHKLGSAYQSTESTNLFYLHFPTFVRWRVRENKLGNIPTTWLSVAMYGIAKMMLLCIRRYIQDTYVFYRGHIRTSIETLRKK